MEQRTPEMLCLLCMKQKATKKNSHIVPVGLLKSNIGERDYEEAYTIAPGKEKPLDSFMGRNNLNNTDTTIKQNPHALDYIFCPNCETGLGIWENEMNPILSKEIFVDPIGKNFQIKNLKQISFLECPQINGSRFILFFYSIIWRMVLKHMIIEEENIFTKKEFEKLRKVIYENLPNINSKTEIPIKEIPLLISTCLSPKINRTGNAVLCHPSHSDPFCFYINDFIVLISFSGSDDLKDKIGKTHPISTLVIENIDNIIDIGLYEKEGWESKQKELSGKLADIFISKYVNNLSKLTKMSVEECSKLLHNQAELIRSQTGMQYAHAFVEGFNRITGQN